MTIELMADATPLKCSVCLHPAHVDRPCALCDALEGRCDGAPAAAPSWDRPIDPDDEIEAAAVAVDRRRRRDLASTAVLPTRDAPPAVKMRPARAGRPTVSPAAALLRRAAEHLRSAASLAEAEDEEDFGTAYRLLADLANKVR
jgi:hypothetical protein